MDFVDCKYEQLGSMNMLAELHLDINFGEMRIQLIDVLNMCGENHESLKLSNLTLVCPTISDSVTSSVLHQIKKLKFTHIYLPPNFGTFISWSFPQLHTLKLKNCLKSSKKAYRQATLLKTIRKLKGYLYIMVPNISLRYLQVIHTFDPDSDVLLVSLCNN